VTSIKNKVFRICGATEEGNGVTSILETSRICGGADDKVFRICGATEEGNGVTSISETSRIYGGSDDKVLPIHHHHTMLDNPLMVKEENYLHLVP
jgi:hypothetical protein